MKQTRLSKVLRKVKLSSIQDKIQTLFDRFANGATVDFSAETKIGDSEYSYSISFDEPIDFSELQNIFKAYGTKDNIYIAEIVLNDTGSYLHVKFNRQNPRKLDFTEILNLLKSGVEVQRYSDSDAIFFSPETLKDLHLYVFISDDDTYTIDLVNYFNGNTEPMTEELKQFLGREIENISLDEVDEILSELGIANRDITKAHRIIEKIKE